MRTGPTHYFHSLHYLLITACRSHQAHTQDRLHLTTHWDQVTCKQCLDKRPMSKELLEVMEKMRGFERGTR